MGELILGVEVGYKTLQFADIDSLAFLAQHTAAFALFLVGTDATAYGRQVALGTDDADGVAQVAL